MAALKNPHPGDILKYEFLDATGLSQNRLAHAIGVPPNRVHAIVAGARRITADTDLRLCRFFGLSEGYFLRLQHAFDMLEAKRRSAREIGKIKPFKVIAA
jgi:antitoxin HigA-1